MAFQIYVRFFKLECKFQLYSWDMSDKIGGSGKHVCNEPESGVGLMHTVMEISALITWAPVSDRILLARFHSRIRNTSVV